MMILYVVEKKRVREDFELSEEFEIKVEKHRSLHSGGRCCH